MKNAFKWLVMSVMLLAVWGAQADPIKDNMLNGYEAGWYPNVYKEKTMSCPDTCEVWVKGIAEHELSNGVKSKITNVCKVGSGKVIEKPVRDEKFLYGNQFDASPVCYTTDMAGMLRKSKQFYCLCISGQCNGPDLVVTTIEKPVWDNANHRSLINVVITNIGSAGAAASIARIIDPSTPQPSGPPFNAIANTPALAAGASTTVTFELPYWVYNPDADLEVTVDYKGMVEECNEKNNIKTFHEIG
ncbi:MAG: CARDB domain-containing protein [Sideroxyarcus sp.]